MPSGTRGVNRSPAYLQSIDMGASIDVDADYRPKKATVKSDTTVRSVGEKIPTEGLTLALNKFPKEVTEGDKVAEALGKQTALAKRTNTLGAVSGGIRAFAGILNAMDKYANIKADAKLNIQLANEQATQIKAIGKTEAFKEESKGVARGKSALLDLVAQGQDVGGALAQDVVKGEELYGIYNAIQIETNAMREALGYESEAVMYESDIRQAKRNRNSEIGNSLVEGGLAAALAFV